MMQVSVFQWVWCAVVWLLFVGGVDMGVGAAAVVSSTILTGSTFYIPDFNRTNTDDQGQIILLVTNQTNGVLLNGPELQVVANTIVYFSLSAVWPAMTGQSVSFGLTRSSVATAQQPADPLGLTPTPASVAALSCTTNTAQAINFQPNTWGLNWTTVNQTQVFSTTPCVVQWAVPPYDASVNATKYYYFDPFNPSGPRQIHIVDGPASPTTPSPSGSGSGTGSGSGNSTTTTSPPTTPSTSSSPTSSSSSSSTGSKVPSNARPSVRVSVWAALVAVLAAVSAAAAAAY